MLPHRLLETFICGIFVLLTLMRLLHTITREIVLLFGVLMNCMPGQLPFVPVCEYGVCERETERE